MSVLCRGFDVLGNGMQYLELFLFFSQIKNQGWVNLETERKLNIL